MLLELKKILDSFLFRFSYSSKVKWIIFLCSSVSLFVAFSLVRSQSIYLSTILRQEVAVVQNGRWNDFLKEAMLYFWSKKQGGASTEKREALGLQKQELNATFAQVFQNEPILPWKKEAHMSYLMQSYAHILAEILKELDEGSIEGEQAFLLVFEEMQTTFGQAYILIPHVDALSYLLSILYIQSISEMQFLFIHLLNAEQNTFQSEMLVKEVRSSVEFWNRVLELMREGGVLHPGATQIEVPLQNFTHKLKYLLEHSESLSQALIGSILVDTWEMGAVIKGELKNIFLTQRHMLHLRDWAGGGVIPLGILVVFMVYLTRVMRKPLEEIRQAAISLANGNLEARVVVTTKDEVAQIGQAFNQMAKFCKDVVSEIDTALNALSLPSKELIANAKGCREHILSQQEGLQNIEKHTKRIWERGTQLQLSLEQVQRHAIETAELAKSGREKLAEMEIVLNVIVEASNRLVEALILLQKKTLDIKEVIGVIIAIVDQATLLSINTAIRTENHKLHQSGFGVIAKKIAELANRIGSSALNVEGELRLIANSLMFTLQAVNKFSERLKTLVTKASASKDSLKAHVDEGQQQNILFEQLSIGMQAQAEEASRVHETILHLSEGAQLIAESITDFSSQITRLHEDTLVLRALIHPFNK